MLRAVFDSCAATGHSHCSFAVEGAPAVSPGSKNGMMQNSANSTESGIEVAVNSAADASEMVHAGVIELLDNNALLKSLFGKGSTN